MTVVNGSWANSTLLPKTGFDYVAAAWESSTTCVIVGNSARSGAILRTTNSGSSWTDQTSSTVQNLLLTDIIRYESSEENRYLITGSNSGFSASPAGYVFTSFDGVDFSYSQAISNYGLNGAAVGINGNAYVVGQVGNIYCSPVGSDWTFWVDITPKGLPQVMLSLRCYSISFMTCDGTCCISCDLN